MIRVAPFFLLFSFAASALAQVDRAAAGFVAALTANDIAAFDAVASADATALPGLGSLRDALERYDCIAVSSYRTTRLSASRIRIDLDATATTRGRNHNRVAFPPTWVVDLSCDGACRITAAMRAEESAAIELLSRPQSEWRSCPVGADLDDGVFLAALADKIAELTEDPELRDRMAMFVRERIAVTSDVKARIGSLVGVALAQRYNQRFPEALATIHEALELARSSSNPDDLARTRFVLGTTLWLAGKVPEGLDELRAVSVMIARLDDPRIALKAMAMRTFIARQVGDVRAALLSADELIAGSRRYRWPQGEVAAGLYLGSIYASMGDLRAGVFYFRGALRKADEIREGRLIAMALANLAETESELHHYRAAIALTRRSIDRYGKTVNPNEEAVLYLQLTEYLRHQGRLAEARAALETARATVAGPPDGEMNASLFIESSELRQAEGDARGALEDARRAAEFSRQGGVLFTDFSSAEVLIRAARVDLALGRGDEAIALFREGIAALESERKAYAGGALQSEQFMESGTEAYRTLVELLARKGRRREAFETSERMRGRALGDVLAQGKIDLGKSMTAAERAKEQELDHLINDPDATPAKRSEARAALQRFETELILIHPSLRLRRPLENNFGPQMPAGLADGAAVEYVVGPAGTIVFTVTAAGLKAREIPISRKEVERRVARLTSAIARRDYGYADDARALYALLLKPIAEDLRGKRAVCVIPDGALWRVPFQALLDGGGHSLIESAAVSYAPSLATLRLAMERRRRLQRRPETIAAIGNSSVAEADREIRTIAALYGRSRVALGSSATSRRFRREAAGASVVHIAAHAVIDDGAPMYSALMLAPEAHNDGALEARAIANLSLDAHTAVLAACDTAGGRVGSGEGIIGLSWAFLLAGCPTTVASQWKTSSAPTAALMIDFHRHLIRQKDPAEALRQAELALARDPRYRHPFYWAPFVVVGAP